jgi:sec-independent protein translocase protein TatC
MADKQEEMSFLDHLEELRWRVIYAFIAIIIGAVVAFVAKSWVFDVVIFGPKSVDFVTYRWLCSFSEMLNLGDSFCFDSFDFVLQNISMSGQLSTHIMVSLIAGVIISFPFLITQVWLFLKPGLTKGEIKSTRGVVFFSSLLFAAGVLFGYYLIAPLSVLFLGGYQVSELVANQINLNSFITTVSSVTLASGLIFQLPILIYFLAKLGFVTPELLKTYRKHALVIVLVLSAIITPPDVMSQILVTIPVMFLYEISILIARRVIKNKAV